MKKKLEQLFDFQRFEASPRLAKLIEQTENRDYSELSDSELACVYAAGEPEVLSYSADPKLEDQ